MGIPAEQLRQRQRLLRELRRLIALNGHADFLFGPILLPDPKYFPDEWRPDLAGARAMLDRLMAWARLRSTPTLLRHENDPTWSTDDDEDYVPPHKAAAWFAGANELGTYLFGVKTEQLSEPETLAGILAHETAHAWRFHRDVMESERELEESLTDLTTVFLGFGVLSANIASLASAELQADGYLSRLALSFTLGVQLTLRSDETERGTVLDALGPDQRVIVREIRELYLRDRDGLIAELGLPRESEWQRPAPLTVPPPAVLSRRAPGRDVVFRVRAPPLLAFAVGAAGLGFLCAMASMWWWWLALPFVATPLALLVKRDRCSGPECGQALPTGARTCRACGGQVVGRIGRRADHDAAERDFLSSDADERSAQARELVKELLGTRR